MEWLWLFFATKLHGVVVVAGVLAFIYATGRQKSELLRTSIIVLPIAFVVGKLASVIINSPRPFVDGHMSTLISHIPDNGFPSDHTLLAVTVGAIVYTQNKVVGSILILLGILVGLGRVLTGVHHPMDVIGSVAIAFAVTYVTVLILRR